MHIVIWTSEGKDNKTIVRKVVGSFRELYYELKKLFQSGSPLVQSEQELDNLMDLAKTVLVHDCEKAGKRCHIKTDNTGNFVCRFKVYHPCNETDFEEIN